jgi:hypothetical protein
MLAQLLTNSQYDSAVRAAAAMHLAHIGSPDAERILVDALELSTDQALTIRIAHALGLIGGFLSVDALRAQMGRGESPLREQTSLSLSIIAFRVGLTGFEPAVPTEDTLLRPDPGQAWPLVVEPIPPSEIGALMSSTPDTYGEDVSSEHGCRIRCGDDEMALVFNRQLTRTESSIYAILQSQIIGFVLDRSPGALESYSTGGLLLSWAHTPSRAHLALFRPSGRLLMFGHASIQRESADFEIVTVRGSGGLPAMLRGVFEGGQVSITEAVSVRTRAALASRHRREPERYARARVQPLLSEYAK